MYLVCEYVGWFVLVECCFVFVDFFCVGYVVGGLWCCW